MSSAVAIPEHAAERLAGAFGCMPDDLTSGRIATVEFEERDNLLRAVIEHPRRGRIGFRGLLRSPSNGYPPTKASRTEPAPPPPSMSPGQALHTLPPRVIERIEISCRAAPGSIGGGQILVISFGPEAEVGSGWFRACVYLSEQNSLVTFLGEFGPLPRPSSTGDLTPEDLAGLVRIFGRLIEWDRAAKAGGENKADQQ